MSLDASFKTIAKSVNVVPAGAVVELEIYGAEMIEFLNRYKNQIIDHYPEQEVMDVLMENNSDGDAAQAFNLWQHYRSAVDLAKAGKETPPEITSKTQETPLEIDSAIPLEAQEIPDAIREDKPVAVIENIPARVDPEPVAELGVNNTEVEPPNDEELAEAQGKLVLLAQETWKLDKVKAIHTLNQIATYDYKAADSYLDLNIDTVEKLIEDIQEGNVSPFG